VKVAVRPEAWRIQANRTVSEAGLAARLAKRAYLGNCYEYSFETALGLIFVVSTELDAVLALGAEVDLSLGAHGVSVFS
jgi:iron(III) transport system ATP-binding protein